MFFVYLPLNAKGRALFINFWCCSWVHPQSFGSQHLSLHINLFLSLISCAYPDSDATKRSSSAVYIFKVLPDCSGDHPFSGRLDLLLTLTTNHSVMVSTIVGDRLQWRMLFSSTQVLSVPLHSDPVWGSCENIAFANRPRQWFKWRWYFKLLPREVFTSSARTSWVLLYPWVLISTGNWLWKQSHFLLMGDSAGQPGSFLEVMYGLVCAWISAYFILCVILEALGNEIKRWWEKIHIKEQMNVSYVLPIKFGFGQCISWSLYHM